MWNLHGLYVFTNKNFQFRYLQRSKMFKHVCLLQRLVAWLHRKVHHSIVLALTAQGQYRSVIPSTTSIFWNIKFWIVHRIICCFNSLLKELLGFLQLWVFKITTNWYSWKNWDQRKNPDNRGSTVTWKSYLIAYIWMFTQEFYPKKLQPDKI